MVVSSRLHQVPEGTEVQVQVLVCEAELLLQLVHALVQAHERGAEALDLVVVERAAVHPPQSLTLHHLAQQVDDRQYALREAALDALWIGVPPAGARARY